MNDLPMLSEIRDEYIQLRQKGNSRADATQALILSYANEITTGAEDDGVVFWIGLADAQYRRKELTADAAQKALAALDQIEQLDWNITPGDISRRRIRYAEAPMPERKVVKTKKFRCTWKIGDTFAYKLSGPDTDACGLSGKYVLLRKVDELEFGDGRLLPIVTFTIWDEEPLPKTAEEFQKQPLLRLVSGRLGLPKTLNEYRGEMLFTRKSMLDALSLIYLGNFTDVSMPEDEAIIRDPGRVMLVLPNQLDKECYYFWKWHTRDKQ